MSDNSTLPATGDIIADEDIGGVKFQKVISGWGPAGTFNKTDIASGKPFPVQLREPNGTDIALGVTLGSLTEAPPGTDTASSGLNGRMQRLAQRVSTLITNVGTFVFGPGTAAASQRVTLASDDPAVAVLGAKADAKNANTDATAISSMSVWKQISASVQATVTGLGTLVFGPGTAAAAQRTTLASDDPLVTIFGAKADAKDTHTDATAISIMAVLKQISASVQITAAGGGGTAVTIADSANATFGAKADAKNAATDATAITAMSVFKQISASVQSLVTGLGTLVFGAGIAAAGLRVTLASDDPAVALLGAKTDAKSTATDATSVSAQSVFKQISASVQLLVTAIVAGAGTAAAAQRMTLASDDPAVALLGAKTDAKSTSTDATSISAMSVWKQISASVQSLVTNIGTFVFGAGTAAAAQRVTLASDDPAVATLGATSGAAVITDATGTIQQYLRGLVKLIASGITTTTSIAASGYSQTTSFTCGTTAYAVNDCVGTGSSNAALDLGVLGPSGGEVVITSASLEIDASAIISGETSYRLYLHNVTPPSAINDSSPWVGVASGDRASFLGYVDLGSPVGLGSSPTTLYVQSDNINKQVKLSGTHLFGYLVTNGAYTPTARVFLITLHTQAP